MMFVKYTYFPILSLKIQFSALKPCHRPACTAMLDRVTSRGD